MEERFKPFGRLEHMSAACPWSIFPRKKLDIGFGDILAAIRACLFQAESSRSETQQNIEKLWKNKYDPSSRHALCCLSVRTAFDMFLRSMQWPPGSEIICSAITIPDMIYLIRYHKLIPVPIDVDPETCAVDTLELKKLMNSKTRAILIAHVFGTRNTLKPILNIVRRDSSHKVYVLEDCAQAYSGRAASEASGADLSFFSFGTIKTSTAFGGALVSIDDEALYEQMKSLNSTYQVRPRSYFFKRVVKYALVHSVTTPAIFGFLLHICLKLNISHDDIITAAIRGFSGGDLVSLIRKRPSVPLLCLLHRRLVNEDGRYVDARQERSYTLTQKLVNMPGVRVPGVKAMQHHYWLYPVEVEKPHEVALFMTAQGFDVTCGATQLTFVDVDPASDGNVVSVPVHAAKIMKGMIYLPVTPETPTWALDKMASCLYEAVNGKSKL